MPLALSSRATGSVGCAPFCSQPRTFSSSSSISDGSVCGLYRPTISMNLPSRGERESATTTRYTGFFFDPTRVNLILTAKPLPPCLRSLLALVGLRRFPLRLLLRYPGQLGQLAPAHALHQLLHLFAPFEQPVDLFDARAGAARDALPPRAVDHARERTLLGRHRQDDRLDARELRLVDLIDPLELLPEPRDQLDPH